MRTDYLLLPDVRATIHDLTMLKHATGLSPPELELLMLLEGRETELPEQEEGCSGFLITYTRRNVL